MKVILDLGEVGTNHCIKETLKKGCCAFLIITRLGTKPWCGLFDEEVLEDDNARLLRCERCKELEETK